MQHSPAFVAGTGGERVGAPATFLILDGGVGGLVTGVPDRGFSNGFPAHHGRFKNPGEQTEKFLLVPGA